MLEDAVRGFNETIASPSGKGTDCDPQDPQDPEEPQEPGVGEGALLFYSVYAAAGEAYGGATSFPRGESNGTQGDAGAGSPQQLAWSFAATFDGERSYNVCDSGDPVTCTTVTYPLSAHKSVSAQMRQVGPLEWEFMYRVDGQINYGYELTAEARALYGDFPIGAVPVFAQGSFLAGVMVNLDRDYVLELTVTSGGSYSRSTATATSDPYNPPSVVLCTLGSGTLGDVPLDLRQTDILNIPRIVNRSNAIGHAANFCLQAESVTGVCPDSVMDPTLVLLLPDGMPIQRLVRPGKRTFGIMLDSFVNFSTNTRLNTVPVRASIDQGQAHVRLRFWPAD